MPVRGRLSFGIVLLLVALAMSALEAASARDEGEPRRFNDSRGYLRVSAAPLLSRELWMGDRPPMTPLLYKLCRQDAMAIVRAQSALSVLCWLALAAALGLACSSWVIGALAGAGVAAFSLTVPVNRWSWVLLSESLSFSLLALLAAASVLLALAARRTGRPPILMVLLWGLCCACFALVRDANIYLLAAGCGALACWALVAALLRRLRGPWAALAGVVPCLLVLAAAVVGPQLLASRSERWQLPLLNVLLDRVVPDADTYALFADRYGMPRNPVFEGFAGRFGWNDSGDGQRIMTRVLGDDPQLADMRAWIARDGKRAYERFLLVDQPGRALGLATRAFAVQVSTARVGRRYGTGTGETPWALVLSRVLYPELRWPLAATLVVAAVAAVLAAVSPAARVPALGALLLVGGAWIQAFVSFHGDTSNVDRHLAACGAQMRLGMLFLCAALGDRLVAVARLRAPRRDASPPTLAEVT